MKKERKQSITLWPCGQAILKESGFGIAEFLVSTVVILSISAGLFTMLTDAQSTSGYQSEVLGVMENTRVAMSTLERIIVQAGNTTDPAFVFTPVTITSDKKVRLCANLTGLDGGNQGDPDTDIADADEDVTIQYNSAQQSIELVAADGTTQTLARYITNFSMQYFDKDGNVTNSGANVRMIRVTITGASILANPKTRKTFGQTLTSDFTLQNRV
jgi:hypothetical protein